MTATARDLLTITAGPPPRTLEHPAPLTRQGHVRRRLVTNANRALNRLAGSWSRFGNTSRSNVVVGRPPTPIGSDQPSIPGVAMSTERKPAHLKSITGNNDHRALDQIARDLIEVGEQDRRLTLGGATVAPEQAQQQNDVADAGAPCVAAQEREHVAEIGGHPANQDGEREQDEAKSSWRRLRRQFQRASAAGHRGERDQMDSECGDETDDANQSASGRSPAQRNAEPFSPPLLQNAADDA